MRLPHQLFARSLLWHRGKGDNVAITLCHPIRRDATRYRVMVDGETEARWVEDNEILISGKFRGDQMRREA